MKLSFGLLLFALAVPAVQAWSILDIVNPVWWATQLVLVIVNAFVDVDQQVCDAVEQALSGISGASDIVSCECSTEGDVTFVVPTAVTATAECTVTNFNAFLIGDDESPATPVPGKQLSALSKMRCLKKSDLLFLADFHMTLWSHTPVALCAHAPIYTVTGGNLDASITASFGQLINGDFSSFALNSISGCWNTAGGPVCPSYTGKLTVDPESISLDSDCKIGTSSGGNECGCSVCPGGDKVSYTSCSGLSDSCTNPTLITGLV